MMGTRDAINDWLEKRRRQARAEGIAEGRVKGAAEGRAELVAEVVAWNELRLAAEARGESFDEPPPGVDDEQG